MTSNDRRAKRQLIWKRQHVMRYLWMFVAVSAAVLGGEQLLAQANVTAVIEATALTHQVLYSVDVSVIDSATLSEPLKIVIESQFGEAEQTVTCGVTEGVFDHLQPNTRYRLSLLVHRGFGYVPIASTTVRTGSALTGGLVVAMESIDYGYGESLVDVTIHAVLNDPDETLLGATLRYAVLPYAEVNDAAIANPNIYETIPINLLDPSISIGPFFNDGQRLILFLEASTASGTVLLDHRVVAFPVSFFHSLSIIDAGPDYLSVSAHVSAPEGISATYQLELWDESNRVAVKTWIPGESDHESESEGIRFERLTKLTHYSVRFIATYIDLTSHLTHTVVLGVLEATTTAAYTIAIRRTVEGQQIRFTLDIWDPSRVIQSVRWQLYAPEINLHQSEPVELVALGNNRFTATFLVTPPENEAYRLWITADKVADASTTYFGAVVAAYDE